MNVETFLTPVSRANGKRCAAQHFGAWAVEPKWFKAAVDAIRAGTWKPVAYDEGDDDEGDGSPGYTVKDGVAIICIDGQMTKKGSSFGGCSTIAVRQALRNAEADWQVRSILLHICSPGGTVSGTADLAEDVARINAAEKKQVHAYAADMCCSAAYWVASQCVSITANTTAIIGSIGTYTVLEDDTGFQEQIGVKYRVVSTGAYKGLGADGKVSDELVADVQREVNELNQPFLTAVKAGRGSKIADIAAVADGRAYVSEQAKQLGLIDRIASLDAAINAITQRSVSMTPTEQVKQIAAEHPEAVASFIESGKKAGIADARKEYAEELRANVEAAKGDYELAVNATLAGHDAATVALAVKAKEKATAEAKAQAEAHAKALAEKDKEIERLKFEAQGQQPVKIKPGEDASYPESDPESIARAEWAKNLDGCQSRFVSEDIYVKTRKRELHRGN